jgi:hypothetical protein
MLDEIEVNTGFVWIVLKISCVLLATGLYSWWLFGAAAIWGVPINYAAYGG